MRRVSKNGVVGKMSVDTSLALEEMELMPEEIAVLRMIHSTNCE